MAQHRPILDPEKISEEDYQKFEHLLLSEDTEQELVEGIALFLAYIPTERAKSILQKFKNSERAKEIEWLDLEMEEAKARYIWPNTDQEAIDLMASKLYHEKKEAIVDLIAQKVDCESQIIRYEIELNALHELQKEKLNADEEEILKNKIMALNELLNMEKKKFDQLEKEMAFEEKVIEKIKSNVQTERYKKLLSRDISGSHLDEEEV